MLTGIPQHNVSVFPLPHNFVNFCVKIDSSHNTSTAKKVWKKDT